MTVSRIVRVTRILATQLWGRVAERGNELGVLGNPNRWWNCSARL